jgi:RNA polymerase sigma-70 factor (ECF subfamily)
LNKVISFIRKPTLSERFESLMEPHFDALYSAARRMTLSPDDAEDLVQEVCITALKRLDELERIEFPRAWLLKVMYNRFVDDTRRTGRSPVHLAATGDASDEPDDIAGGMARPDELVDREQEFARILRAMRCLNAEQCALVAMHDVEGVSIDELCTLTGMPAGTIKSQLHRTRRKLGRLLSDEAITRPHLKIIGGKQ